MRVCHVWERFWPIEIGGLERYILWLTNYLGKKTNIEFSLVTGRTKILHLTKNIKKNEDAGFLKVHRLGPSPADWITGALMYSVKSTPELVGKMRLASICHGASKLEAAQKADVFHIHGIWQDLEWINLGIYLSRRFHKPLVVTLHGGFVGDPLHGGMPLQSPAVKSILEKDVAAITTYSKEVLSVLQGMGLGGKSYLLTNFVDPPHFKNPNSTSPPPREATAIYVGRLEHVQTPDIVIKAFKQVHKQLPQAKLTVVGYGTMYDELKAMVKEFDLKNSVSMVGKQSDVRKFLWSSDVFVATNFGYIASLEAWSAGLAVVAPNFGVLKETIAHEKNGLLFDPDNVDSLAAALIRLLRDRDLRAKLAFNGAETVKNYDIREVAPKMGQIYRSVLNRVW